MRLKLLAVGRMKAGPERELYDRYAERIGRAGKSLHLTGPELIEVPESRAPKATARKEEESTTLLNSMGNGARIILFDEFGKDISSREFASLLSHEQDGGATELNFAIGGPDGHGEAMKNAAFRKIRIGSMTWPHQIARILVVEQIYRAITILSGHPYHRD